MKILRILPSMDFGGIERGVHDFSIRAVEMGHEVIVASGPGRFIPSMEKRGVICRNLPMNRKTLPVFFSALRDMESIIREADPDIVHVQSRFSCWIARLAMKRFPGLPWVTSIHSFNRKRFYSRSEGMGDLVITVSRALKTHAREFMGIPERKIRVVYNGVSKDFLSVGKSSSPCFRAGMISRFSLYKGHYIFLEAIRLLRERMKIKGIIIGSGSPEYRKSLESWISANGMETIVEITEMDAKKALGEMDLLVVPSYEPEGFGRTVAEAQMSGTPVIGTNLGAIPELIDDGKTGFLVDPGNAGQVADRISYVSSNPGPAGIMAAAARENALKHFTLDRMAEGIISVYRELLVKGGEV